MRFGSPCPEVTLYVLGMLCSTLGVCGIIASSDPRPFDSGSWTTFLAVGMFLLCLGMACLTYTIAMPECPTRTYFLAEGGAPRASYSAVDLLEEVQSVGAADSPAVKVRGPAIRLQITEETVRTVKSCMMLQSPNTAGEGIVFYKETVV